MKMELSEGDIVEIGIDENGYEIVQLIEKTEFKRDKVNQLLGKLKKNVVENRILGGKSLF
ncbi:hypothetical protein [Sporosarcina sp. FA9]|uniref:hypothetical protein n=1 Tax=Sporosarcina sp. FA9 TaxID=3413030 RepID=UPI003F65985C